jgi:sodium/hydrogen antiporter
VSAIFAGYTKILISNHLLDQIALGTVIGALIGIGFRHLMKFCERQELIDRQSYVAQYVSLALLTIGVCTMLGSDDLLAAFACGTAFAWDGFFNRQTEESVFSSVIDLLFNVAAFVFLGAWMPFNDFHAPELTIEVWRLIVIGILVLVLRRLPVIVALYKWIPDVKTFREAVFSGHFGPISVGAVFISTLAAERLPQPHEPPQSQAELLAASIQPIVAFMVLCSILVHGLSIPFFSLGRRVHSVRREWSRRSTIDTNNAPEWTQQTRRIRPGEDVVINRDSMMERGEIPREEREKAERGTREGSPDDSLTAKEAEKAHEREKAPERADSGIEVGEDKREEAPPDGDEILNEWQEGPHKVVEKRAGPGEEVRRSS